MFRQLEVSFLLIQYWENNVFYNIYIYIYIDLYYRFIYFTNISEPDHFSKIMRKDRPFLAAFKKERNPRDTPLGDHVEKDPKINSGKKEVCLEKRLTSPTSRSQPNHSNKFSASSKPPRVPNLMGNLISGAVETHAQGKILRADTDVDRNMKSTRTVSLVKSDARKRDIVNVIENEPRTISKECEEGECESSSDEDIIIIDEKGEKIEETQTRKSSRSQEKKDNDESQKNLCEFNKISITVHDYKTLKEGEYLNDTIIDFYLAFLYETSLSKAMKSDVHIYSSHFYSRLKGNAYPDKSGGPKLGHSKSESAYQRVKSWTRKLNIFSKRMLIFPICEEDHWYLIIVCNPGLIEPLDQNLDRMKITRTSQKASSPTILLLDSLGLSQPKSVGKIRSYLHYEYLERNGISLSFGRDKIKLTNMNVPLQPNECDCGIYLLHYVQLIFQNPLHYLENNIPDLCQWFVSKNVDNKRKDIESVILKLARESNNSLKYESGKDSSVALSGLEPFGDKPNRQAVKNKLSPAPEDLEPCMLFRSPPREINSKNQISVS